MVGNVFCIGNIYFEFQVNKFIGFHDWAGSFNHEIVGRYRSDAIICACGADWVQWRPPWLDPHSNLGGPKIFEGQKNISGGFSRIF